MNLELLHGAQHVAVALPTWLDLASVIVGSLAGVIAARERHLDAIGFIGLAIVCGLGGGLIRDIIMQKGDVYMLNSPFAISSSVLTGTIGFFFSSIAFKAPRLMILVDIIAVGLFAAVGADKAIIYGLNAPAVILMGTMTGVGGGMLRDVFLGNVPKIFQRSNLYALCAVAGSVLYWLMVQHLSVNKLIAAACAVTITIILRFWSLDKNIMTPTDVDLGPRMAIHMRKLAHKTKITTTLKRNHPPRSRSEADDVKKN